MARRRGKLALLQPSGERLKAILILPEPGDTFGHADGVLRFVDADTVVVNDYTARPRRCRRD